jgi:hypothetical protein
MAASMPNDLDIPRYLRYKAEDKNADDYWDEELERANSILHNRVKRMERDKLCVGCARFDWLRTHFYTREAKRSGGRDLNKEDLKIRNDFKANLADQKKTRLRTVALHGIEDNVQWKAFQIIPGMENSATRLAEHPRFEWIVQESETLACTLCSAIFAQASTRKHQSSGLRSDLTVTLKRGCFLEKGGDHRCYPVGLLIL